jgi:hypothetical protein
MDEIRAVSAEAKRGFSLDDREMMRQLKALSACNTTAGILACLQDWVLGGVFHCRRHDGFPGRLRDRGFRYRLPAARSRKSDTRSLALQFEPQ